MFAVIVLGLLAGCTAAPHYHHHPRPGPPGVDHWYPYINNEPFFDTRQFWADLHTEMRELDNMLNEFYKNFPAITSQQGIQGNEYHVTIPLNGFKEEEVVVKVRQGVLMVQAVHKTEGGGENSYLDVKTLPDCVDVSGTWTLENGILKIVFPLKGDVQVNKEPEVTEAPGTEAPELEPITEVINNSREEMESQGGSEDATADADVGLRGDLEKGREIQTNEIPRSSVEATTYAVDFKDEVEFVPVRY